MSAPYNNTNTLFLDIIIQPLRFDILEEFGCIPTMSSFVTYILIVGPELLFSAVAAALIRTCYID